MERGEGEGGKKDGLFEESQMIIKLRKGAEATRHGPRDGRKRRWM